MQEFFRRVGMVPPEGIPAGAFFLSKRTGSNPGAAGSRNLSLTGRHIQAKREGNGPVATVAGGGPTRPILEWPKAPDFADLGHKFGEDNRNHYFRVDGKVVLEQSLTSGDRYFYLPVGEVGKPGAIWRPFKPIGLAQKEKRDADPHGFAEMRKIAGAWTGLVEADWNEIGHTVLDAVGLVPIFGEVADFGNGIWYAVEGDPLNAGLSMSSMVPFAGMAVFVVKKGKVVQKITKDSIEYTVRTGDDFPVFHSSQKGGKGLPGKSEIIERGKKSFSLEDLNKAKKLDLNLESAIHRNIYENLDELTQNYISKFRKQSILAEFPGEFLEKSVYEVLVSRNRTARKLLTDGRFVK